VIIHNNIFPKSEFKMGNCIHHPYHDITISSLSRYYDITPITILHICQISRWATVQGCVLSSLHSSSLPSRCCWCAVVAVTSFLTSSSPSSPTYQVESPSPSSSLSSSSTYLIIILLLLAHILERFFFFLFIIVLIIHIIITICHHYHNYSSPTKSEIFPQA